MGIPKSVVKIKRDGIEYTESVDRTNYLITELIRAALRDVGKFICNRTRQKIKRKTGRLAKNIQFWARKKEGDLQVGFKPAGFYGGYQELGTQKQPKIGALYDTVKENINEIRNIEAQYLSAIENEQKALSLVSDEEYQGE